MGLLRVGHNWVTKHAELRASHVVLILGSGGVWLRKPSTSFDDLVPFNFFSSRVIFLYVFIKLTLYHFPGCLE